MISTDTEVTVENSSLTQRQAEAYRLRRGYSMSRGRVAAELDCSRSNVDNLIQAAEKKIDEAKVTLLLAGEANQTLLD